MQRIKNFARDDKVECVKSKSAEKKYRRDEKLFLVVDGTYDPAHGYFFLMLCSSDSS